MIGFNKSLIIFEIHKYPSLQNTINISQYSYRDSYYKHNLCESTINNSHIIL